MQKTIKKLAKTLFSLGLLFFLTISLFELVFRFYLIDFYKNTFIALNGQEILKTKKVDFLIFGDSFSALKNGYVDHLKSTFPDKTFINLSVPGIGIKQVNGYAENKIKTYNPDVIIYQVYVGNDLLDIKNLSNWSELSFSRNLYWQFSNYYLSLRYLNQSMSIFRQNLSVKELNLDKQFSNELYNKRELMFFKADQQFLENTITLKADFKQRYNQWKNALNDFLENIPKDKKVYIVFVPHCAQVNEFYFDNMLKIGAAFSSQNEIINANYSFFENAKNDFKNYKNVNFFNPINYLQEKDKENYRLYYQNDPHFNKNGQQELANYISTIINQ